MRSAEPLPMMTALLVSTPVFVTVPPPAKPDTAPVVGLIVMPGQQLKFPFASATWTQFDAPLYGCH